MTRKALTVGFFTETGLGQFEWQEHSGQEEACLTSLESGFLLGLEQALNPWC